MKPLAFVFEHPSYRSCADPEGGGLALAVCRAHRGLPIGFLLLWYSGLFTIKSLSMLYILVIS